MEKTISEIFVIASGVLALAMVSVLVSRNANTSQVVSAAGSSFGGLIATAISPVTGADFGGSLSMQRPNFQY